MKSYRNIKLQSRIFMIISIVLVIILIALVKDPNNKETDKIERQKDMLITEEQQGVIMFNQLENLATITLVDKIKQVTPLNNTKAEWINIKSCGAKGDGVTDDTKAFDRAKKLGNNIYFPSGTYVLKNASISNKKNVSIIGDNAELLCSKNSTPYFGVLGFFNINGLYISGITINGNKQNVPGSESGGVFNFYLKNCSNFNIENCKSVNSNYGANVFYDNCHDGIISNCIFDDIDCGLIFANTDDAVKQGDLLPSHDIVIRDCIFKGGTSEGISLSTRLDYDDKSFYQHYNFDIFDCVFDGKSNSGSSILLMNSKSVNVKNCTFRNTKNLTNTGIVLFKANNTDIFGCTFNNIYYRAILVGNLATTTIISGCSFKGGKDSPSVKIYGENTIFKCNTLIDATSSCMVEINADKVTVSENTFVLNKLPIFKYNIRVVADCNNVRINNNTFINDNNIPLSEVYVQYGSISSYVEILGNNGIKNPRLENTSPTDVRLYE
ncbi:MAG: glycosyl hydrolase family 28-related protein [Mobilitalea sp.]